MFHDRRVAAKAACATTAAALMLFGSGCAHWTHAPGFADRDRLGEAFAMTPVPWRLCVDGLCTLRGRSGDVRFVSVGVGGLNDLRTHTAFRVEYAGTTLDCRHPSGRPDDPSVLVCRSLAESTQAVSVSLAHGCLEGVARVGGADLQLRTDVVRVLGMQSPARELALFDTSGSLVGFVDSRGKRSGLTVYGPRRHDAALTDAIDLIAAAWYSFTEQDGHPEGCVVPG
jgi:hypothetical protein